MKRRKPRKPLAEYRPDLALQWHPTRNGQLTPMDVGTGTKRKVWWKCPEGDDHEWEALISSRASGRGCPFCAGYGVSYTNSLAETYPEVAAEWHPTKNGSLTPRDIVHGSDKRVFWKCPKGEDHEWEAVIVSRTRLGSGCPQCRGLVASEDNNLADAHPELAAQWHPSKNGSLEPFEVTSKSKKKVWWKCPRGIDHIWQADVGSRAAGRGCPFCANQRLSVTNRLSSIRPDLVSEWHPIKNGNLTPDDITAGGGHVKHWWQCLTTSHHEWQATASDRIADHGCPYCSGNKLAPENSVAAVSPELVEEWDYEKNAPVRPNQVSRGSNVKYWWRCKADPTHLWDAAPHSRTNGHGCPECTRPLRSSKGEMKLLELIRREFPEVEVIHHAKPVWLGRMHFDIYLPDIGVAIEYQGRQHLEPVEFFGGEKSFELQKKRDIRKRELCEANNCYLFEYAKGWSLDRLLGEIESVIKSTPS